MISEANCITKEPCDAHEVLKCWNDCKKRGSRTKYAIEYSRDAASMKIVFTAPVVLTALLLSSCNWSTLASTPNAKNTARP